MYQVMYDWASEGFITAGCIELCQTSAEAESVRKALRECVEATHITVDKLEEGD